MALAGCIPMVPGAFMSQAILGLLAVTAPNPANEVATIVMAMEYMLRVIFTLGAIGAGLAIPSHLLQEPGFLSRRMPGIEQNQDVTGACRIEGSGPF